MAGFLEAPILPSTRFTEPPIDPAIWMPAAAEFPHRKHVCNYVETRRDVSCFSRHDRLPTVAGHGKDVCLLPSPSRDYM